MDCLSSYDNIQGERTTVREDDFEVKVGVHQSQETDQRECKGTGDLECGHLLSTV